MDKNLYLRFSEDTDVSMQNRVGVVNEPGIRYRVKFNNGLGASIIKNSGSYGYEEDLWELAILGTDGKIIYPEGYEDPFGYLTEEDVYTILNYIKEDRVNELSEQLF